MGGLREGTLQVMKTKRAAPAKHGKAKPTAKRRPTSTARRTSAPRKAFDLDAFCTNNQLQPSERYRRFIGSAEAEGYQGRYVTGLPVSPR